MGVVGSPNNSRFGQARYHECYMKIQLSMFLQKPTKREINKYSRSLSIAGYFNIRSNQSARPSQIVLSSGDSPTMSSYYPPSQLLSSKFNRMGEFSDIIDGYLRIENIDILKSHTTIDRINEFSVHCHCEDIGNSPGFSK